MAGAQALTTAGAFGVRDEAGDLSWGLPSLNASAMTFWRGRPVVGLAAGGLFLRRDGRWEELLTGQGALHVRILQESAGGQLWIGAREGLFRTAWGAPALERLDGAPVRALALGEGGLVLAGGEEGLRRVEPGRVTQLAAPDPWIDWVGLCAGEVWLVTPAGLARGPRAAPGAGRGRRGRGLGGGGGGRGLRPGRRAAAALRGRPRRGGVPAGAGAPPAGGFGPGVRGHRGRPVPARRLRLGAGAAPARLPPPGAAHVSALGLMGSRALVLGAFDGGLALGETGAAGWAWSPLPSAPAWAVNAILAGGDGLYVASLRGAARFDGARWTALGDPATGPAFALAATRDGIAVGYGQGVRCPGRGCFRPSTACPGTRRWPCAPGAQLFVGTPSGLGAVSGGKVAWRVTAGEGRLPHPWVTALADRAEGLYIGTYGGGVARRVAVAGSPKGRFEAFPETQGFKVNPGCLVEAGGRLFMGTDGQGLFRLSRDGARFEPLSLPLPSGRVTALLPGPGALWVGTDEGLARLPLPLADGDS